MTSQGVSTTVLILVLCLDCFILQGSVHGAVVISPSPRVALCCVGDELEVSCTATETTLVTWTLTIIGLPNSISRLLAATTVHHDVVTVNSTILTFSRVSDLGASPFKSKLAVPAVSQGLNGTRITCMDRSTGAGTASMATTTVYIYGDQGYQPNAPILDFEEEFGEERVTIHLNWTQSENLLVSYSVSIVPRNGSAVSIIDSTRANLTLSYNTPYNMTVVADICGQRNATTLIKFSYVKCGDPFDQLSHDDDSESILVKGYTISGPVHEGDQINFTCISGMELIGPNSITCMANGEWEPNPREVECKVNCGPPLLPDGGYIIPYTSTLEEMEVIYICRNQPVTAVCTKRGYWEPNSSDICAFDINTTGPSSSEVLSQEIKIAAVSSVTVFVITSILFFTVGFLCGHFKRKTTNQTTPLYENVQPNQCVQELELKANVAYSHVHVMN